MKSFYSLSEVVDRIDLDIDFFISQWMIGKLYLFIHFDGEQCTLRHCRENNDDFKYNVINGADLFQHENSPLHEYLGFIPEKNLENHFKCKFYHEWSIRFFKGYNEYRYNGMAYGYWHIRPTKTTHFNRTQYLLSDKENYDNLKNKSGVVFASPFYNADYDYLIFNTPVTIKIKNLYIERETVDLLFNEVISESVVEDAGSVNSHGEDENKISFYYPPNSRFALYILINECFAKNGTITPSKVAWFFKEKGISINQSTVKGWLDNPPAERNIKFREKIEIKRCCISYCMIFLTIKDF
ncbi:hypothetical protein [Citrobacter tructae]|uniref:Helix-turn-helix domain-containing protein n=1 Tax=Citrobacter tructae TaxID=2562449 RepID=A0ABX5T815_9ENTR|nr:hypothetical protein [Citrobacter tructae]QBX82571.1 hypothetical protein E4Z61_20290 [Citrobacter tructae]